MSTDVVTISADHPAYQVDDGFEVDVKDMVLPRFKIAQGLTKEVQDGTARPGEIINSLTGESYGNKVQMVVLSYRRGQLYMSNQLGGLVCRSDDGVNAYGDPFSTGERGPQSCTGCPLKEWDGKTKPLCAEAHQYLVLLPDSIEVGNLTLTKTGVKTAKLLNTMVAQNRERARRLGEPAVAWGTVYELSTREMVSNNNKYFVPAVRPLGKADEGVLAYATEMFSMLQQSNISYGGEEAESEAAPAEMPTQF